MALLAQHQIEILQDNGKEGNKLELLMSFDLIMVEGNHCSVPS